MLQQHMLQVYWLLNLLRVSFYGFTYEIVFLLTTTDMLQNTRRHTCLYRSVETHYGRYLDGFASYVFMT